MSVKIFLSAVSDEFRDYRDQLRSDLKRHNVEVEVQEDFKDYGIATLDKLDLYISTCDAVIHLVGDMTGAGAKPASTAAILMKYPDIAEKLPPLREPLDKGLGISYTQWEAWLALYHGKALLIAKADDTAPRGPNYNPTGASRAAQQMHLRRLSDVERYPGCTFTNLDNLGKHILNSILDLIAKEQQIVREVPRLPWPSLIVMLFLLLLTPLAADHLTKTIGLTLAAPISLLGAAGGLALALLYWRYLGILGAGAEPLGSLERQAYDALRASFATGGLPARLYSRWLDRFLNAVDRFFGDAGMADRTLFPRAFGLRTPAPLWTAPALDRCLLLALIYPIVTILIMWAVSGHVGPAEEALALVPGLSGWRRGLVIAAVGFAALIMRWSARTKGRKSLVWLAVAGVTAGAFTVAGFYDSGFVFAIAFIVAVSFVFGGAIASTSFAADAIAVASKIAVALVLAITISIVFAATVGGSMAFAVIYSGAGMVAGAGAVAVTFAVSFVAGLLVALMIAPGLVAADVVTRTLAFAGILAIFAAPVTLAFAVALLSDTTVRNKRQGSFLSVFLIAMTLACVFAAASLSSLVFWTEFHLGALLLFLGLLTLLNAPFDWASLGLTRALLRRGLELGGWWPYFLALLDALLAGVIIALLALTMVIGVQAFDALAVHGGGKPVLPLTPLFNGLAAHPEAPEYWWIYALLLSTMIPSLVNLVIGGTALTRTAPGLPSLLLRFMPAGRAVPAFDRGWIALVLTLQVAGGVILGIAAQVLLAVGLMRYVMPWAGLGLLDMARAVAAFDLPARVAALF
jgi:hypothetical protein